MGIQWQSLFRRGDIDGAFALGLETFVQVMLIVNLCQTILGFSASLIYGRILPGIGISVLLCSGFYGWLAYQQNQHQGRTDLTALPSGINLISIMGHIFLVMLPVRTVAIAQGLSTDEAAELAWQAGLMACFSTGMIKLFGLFGINFLRRHIPLAASLSTLASIGLMFIAMGFVLRTFTYPLVGFVPLGIILLTYFGEVQFAIPGGLLAILFGTVLAWTTGLMHWDTAQLAAAWQPVGVYSPKLWLVQLWQGHRFLLEYLSVILPLGLFDFTSSLQSMESAAVSGDAYPPVPAMVGHSVCTLLAAVCGSCFPTMIYIGHPGWKAMGSGSGYSFLAGLFGALLGFSGSALLVAYFIPLESGMAVFIAIGICIVVQSFTAPPQRHAPAVVVGLLPGIAAWGALMAKGALHAAGKGTPTDPLTPALLETFQQNNLFVHGAFALEQGHILAAIALASMTVYIIEQKFHLAGIWALIAAGFSWFGLIHSYAWTTTDTIGNLQWGAGSSWAAGYGLLAILFFYTAWKSRSQTQSSTPPIGANLSSEPVD